MILFDPAYMISIFMASIVFWSLVKDEHKTMFIIITSLIALAFVQPKFTLFLILLVMLVYFGSLQMQRSSSLKWLYSLVLILVIVLISAKYMKVLLLALFSGESGFAKNYLVPLGVSYLIFKLIAYVLDVYRGVIQEPNPTELMAFILFLPTFPAGPIERYQNFAGLRRSEFDMEFYHEGLKRLSIGYFKKVVIVNFALNETVIKMLFPIIDSNGVSMNLSAHVVIVFLIGALLYAYFDLSAYADIAIGYGHLFGYKICENMNYPILQKNLSDYWNCWHISLSHWCRNNVYLPVLGKTRNIYLGLYASFIVMGLWHRIYYDWLFWGLWHATGLIIFTKWSRFKKKRKYLKKLVPARIGYLIGMMITLMYASMGYSFVMMGSVKKAFRVLAAIIL